MIYSHFLDLIGKLFSMIFCTILLVILAVETGWDQKFTEVISSLPFPKVFYFLTTIIWATAVFLGFHRPVVDVLVTKMYVRLHYKVNASWQEAKLLRRLFCLNRRLQWYPMEEVRSLPREERLKALIAAANGK